MQLNFAAREVTIKLVYYGPALSGKTTNLQALHRIVSQDQRTRLMTLETRDDRTLFFDLLPVTFRSGDLSLRVKVFTVPGQVIHNATRRLVLQGADGVVFIADSQISETRNNAESFVNLKQNLREQGIDIKTMPLVIQFNKRDLPDVRPDAELDALARRGREPVFKAVATAGEGVVETFFGLLRLTWSHLQAQHRFDERFGVDPQELLQTLASRLHLPKSVLGAPGESRMRAGGGGP